MDMLNSDPPSTKPRCQSILTFQPFPQQLIPDSRPPRTWLVWTHQTTPCRFAFLSLHVPPSRCLLFPLISVIDVRLKPRFPLWLSLSLIVSNHSSLRLFLSTHPPFQKHYNSKVLFSFFFPLLRFICLSPSGCHQVQIFFIRDSSDIKHSDIWSYLWISGSKAG